MYPRNTVGSFIVCIIVNTLNRGDNEGDNNNNNNNNNNNTAGLRLLLLMMMISIQFMSINVPSQLSVGHLQ